MVKKIDLSGASVASLGTAEKWYKRTDEALLSNTGQTPIRVDKILTQFSCYHSAVAPIVMGVVVHMSDETDATFSDGIVAGTTGDAELEVLMNQWKDLIWMTDFEVIGTGTDEMQCHVSNLEAGTRRLLNPGQSLYITVLARPIATETSKSLTGFIDNILWYSPAAQ